MPSWQAKLRRTGSPCCRQEVVFFSSYEKTSRTKGGFEVVFLLSLAFYQYGNQLHRMGFVELGFPWAFEAGVEALLSCCYYCFFILT